MNKFIYTSKLLLLVTLMVIALGGAKAQSRKDLERKKKKTQSEIIETSKLLDETKEGRKKSYNNLLILNEQISSRKRLINRMNDEVGMIDEQIRMNEDSIKAKEAELALLKERYAQMIRTAERLKSAQDRLVFVFAADDFNQAYKRLAYMKDLAKYRRKQAAAIVETQKNIEAQNAALDSVLQTKLNLLSDKERERRNLNRAVKEQNTMISHLKLKEKDLKQKLQKQKAQATKLQKEIERLIAEEAKRAASGVYELTPEEKLISQEFGNNKGRLPYPVGNGVITGHFGKQPHPVIKGVYIQNNGVDISTSKGNKVRAIFGGEVRKIFKVPGYQTAVIIRHGAYLTTYTHLDEVYVAVGQKVTTKQEIGKVHTDVNDGKTVVHFEIWQGQKVLNPEKWLAK